MYQEQLLANVSFEEIPDDPMAELVRAVSSLYTGGMTRRGISELLSIHEMQVRELIDVAFGVRAH